MKINAKMVRVSMFHFKKKDYMISALHQALGKGISPHLIKDIQITIRRKREREKL